MLRYGTGMTQFPLDRDLTLTVDEAGTGRPALILHGGGGPATVAMIAGHLADRMHTITPTHPGWNGAQRPDRLDRVVDYAMTYLRYLHARDLRDVLVVGSSMGGWIGAEMAARDTAGRISGLVLIDATGVEIPGEPIPDFFALDPRGVAEKSFHDPDRFYVDPATIPTDQLAIRQANMATMRLVAGTQSDPTLLGRLDTVRVPVLGIWGDSDGFVTPEYGRAFVDAFPKGCFEIIEEAGHLPQIEQPAATFALIDEFAKR
jgi:pimeloyl-ACP methyl ester carboxylesterase